MATADEIGKARVGPRVKVDAQGRALRRTPEEQRERDEALREALAAMAAIRNGPDEDDRDFFRAMDEARPDCPPFKGLY